MTDRNSAADILSQMDRDRKLIADELPELHQRDARMRESAEEETLSGHLRRAIHRSGRPLGDIASQAGISTTVLCAFLEGERTLRSDVLDRLAQAAAVHISLSSQ